MIFGKDLSFKSPTKVELPPKTTYFYRYHIIFLCTYFEIS